MARPNEYANAALSFTVVPGESIKKNRLPNDNRGPVNLGLKLDPGFRQGVSESFLSVGWDPGGKACHCEALQRAVAIQISKFYKKLRLF